MAEIPIGAKNEQKVLVTPDIAIDFLGHEGGRVLATPHMIMLMEMTCRNLIKSFVEEGFDSVGTEVNVKHLAATPIGMSVTFQAEVLEVNDRRVLCRVEAFDEQEKIGEGTHERFVINVARFASRLAVKLGRQVAMPTTRRAFLAQASLLAQSAPQRFYTVREQKGRWWMFTPTGEQHISLGLNHIDPAGLRYAENGAIWRDKYGNSMRRWLEESVRPNLLQWGFNCVGWSQEVVTRGLTNHRHSRAWTFEEYQWLNLPYCHLLPFADFHQWEAETRNPSLFSSDFADWCDHVAREHCVPLANDSKLIGYFFIDCPTWVHTKQWSAWKGPMFDPKQLESAAGRKQLHDMATQYYRVTSEAIRRYDKNHLILGDRYEAAEPIPMEVVQAALPYVDVLCFQHFAPPEKIAANLSHWHKQTGKPVLVADSAGNVRGENGAVLHNPKHYPGVMAAIREVPGAVGYHLCGAYTTNRTRRRGLLDEQEKPNSEVIAAITRANREIATWARTQA